MKKSPLQEKIICVLAAALFRIFYLTYRFRWHGLEREKAARSLHPKGQVAIAIWHRNSIGCLLSHAWRRLAILVSLSFDGEVIAYVAKSFGIHSARGSSSRGGMEAFKQLLTLHKQGYDLGITVDGPRGPLYVVKAGIIAAAARTGMPVLPFTAVARHEWVLHKAWDKFRVPKPFTTIDCLFGEALAIPQEAQSSQFEGYAEEVGKRLLALEDELKSRDRLNPR